MATSDNLSDLPLENVDKDTLKVPKFRISNARVGREIFFKMQMADRKRNLMRSRHQAQLDGEPPFDQTALMASGQGTRTNVNWGDAKHIHGSFMGGVIDMNSSVERLVSVPIFKNVVPDDAQRAKLENIVASELTRAIRGWEGYDMAYLSLGHFFGAHGVGIAYFDDERDWRFETTGLGDFCIPDGTKASENEITVCGCLRRMELHKLYSCIRNEGPAAKSGWNLNATKKAMSCATPDYMTGGWDDGLWLKLQQELRNNDLGASMGGKTSKVALIHMWVQEMDGTVSKYICTREALPGYGEEEEEPWLYQKANVYPEMRRGVVFFPYGIGDNGTYHSISGILRSIYPQINAINRTQSNMLDAANLGVGMVLQPTSEQHLSRMKIINLGCVHLVPSADHATIVPHNMPNMAQGVLPVIADMRNTIGQRAGQFQGDGAIGGNQEKTRFQVAAELEMLGKVGATQLNLWYPAWTRLLRECCRRLCAQNYSKSWPGGKEAVEFRRRLVLRGFPEELLQAVDYDSIVAERAVGAGSGAARIGQLESIREMTPEFDVTGRYRATRDLLAAKLGGDYSKADNYMPEMPGERPTQDFKNANFENSLMELNQEQVVAPNDLHLEHLRSHVPFLGEMLRKVEASEVTKEEIIEQMMLVYEHSQGHLEGVQDSPIMQQEVAQYRQTLQQMGAIVTNIMREVIADQQKAAEQEQEEGGNEMSEKLQEDFLRSKIKVEEMQQKVNFKRMEQEQQLQYNEQKFLQDAAHKDANVAADLFVRTKKQLADVQTQQKKAEDALKVAEIKRAAQVKKSKDTDD